MKIYVSGYLSDKESFPVKAAVRLKEYIKKGEGILITKRRNVRDEMKTFLSMFNRPKTEFLPESYVGLPELWNAAAAEDVNADRAFIFWDQEDAYTVMEIMILTLRSIPVDLCLNRSGSVVEIDNADDLKALIPPRREGSIRYCDQRRIPESLLRKMSFCPEMTEYMRANTFDESGIVAVIDDSDLSLKQKARAYNSVVLNGDIIHDLIENNTNIPLIDILASSAWLYLRETKAALDALDLRDDEILACSDINGEEVNKNYTSHRDLLKDVRDGDAFVHKMAHIDNNPGKDSEMMNTCDYIIIRGKIIQFYPKGYDKSTRDVCCFDYRRANWITYEAV